MHLHRYFHFYRCESVFGVYDQCACSSSHRMTFEKWQRSRMLEQSHKRWMLVSALKEQVTGQEGMASSCTRGCLDWVSGKKYSWKGL